MRKQTAEEAVVRLKEAGYPKARVVRTKPELGPIWGFSVKIGDLVYTEEGSGKKLGVTPEGGKR